MKKTAMLLIYVLLALGCVPEQEAQNGQGQSNTAASQQPAPAIAVTLVRTDLGLEDGQFVRQADAVFTGLDGTVISYTAVGELLVPMTNEAGLTDVGLPEATSDDPGEMTIAQAEALLDEIGETGWLVLSTPLLLDAALAHIAGGAISAELILLLDDYGLLEAPVDPAVPVYAISYDIQPVAFLLGIAAAESSNNGMFVVMASEADPHAQEFLDAVWTGAKYHTNGAIVADTILPVNAADGLITMDVFLRLHRQLRQRMGQYFTANHFILALGRTTPTLLYACTSEPFSGYVAGGYADFRQVRPARILGCAEKLPDAALRYIFSELGDGTLADLADGEGLIAVGVEQAAVGFTGFEMYSRYNPDGDDIAEAVENVWAEIRTGELDVPRLIERFKSKEHPADASE